MSLWQRLTAGFGSRSGDAREVSLVEDRLVFHTLVRAKALPNEPGAWGPGEKPACERCSAAVRPVVFTTAGKGEEQIALWRAYPLAVDGWMCAQCGWSAVPRRMSAQEVTDCIQNGVEHARAGALDDGEYWFRRAACSWPDYAPALANLAVLLTTRAEAPDREESEREALRAAAERYLRRALEKDPTNLQTIHVVTLARLEAFAGREDDALRRLAGLDREDLPAASRADIEDLRVRIREGRALFSRASELAMKLILLHGRAPTPLSNPQKEHLREAARLLEEACARHRTAFANWWLLGKVRQRLGEHRAALEALRRALECDSNQVDGHREYAAICLELGEGAEAVRVSSRACELRPDDAGLQSNLALALLIAGRIEDAAKAVDGAARADPADKITRALQARIAAVREGRRPAPRNLAELEGRR